MLSAIRNNQEKVAGLVIPSLIAFGIWLTAAFVLGPASAVLHTYVSGSGGAGRAERLTISADGDAALVRYGPRGRKQEYHDLNGKQIEEFDESSESFELGFIEHPLRAVRILRGSSRPWSSRIAGFRADGTNWFLVRSAVTNTAWFEGYDKKRRGCVGYVGTNGFLQHRPASSDCFQLSTDFGRHHINAATWSHVLGYAPLETTAYATTPSSVVLLATQDGLDRIDLRDHSVERVFESKNIGAVNSWAFRERKNNGQDRIAVRTDKEVMFLDREGLVLDRIAIPPGHAKATLTLWPYSETELVLSAQADSRRIFWFERSQDNASVKLVREEDGGSMLDSASTATLWFASLFAPAPSALFAPTWWFAAVVIQVGALLSGLTWYLETRSGRQQRTMWTVFVFIFGIFGLVTYWLHIKREKQISCGSCQESIPPKTKSCMTCGELLPLPALTGTEIFA